MSRQDVLVVGGISHWSFSGRLPPLDDLRDGAVEQAIIMERAGADLIMLEMMIEISRMLAVLKGAKTSGVPVWVGFFRAPDAEGGMCLQAGETDTNGVAIAQPGELLVDAITALEATRSHC